VDLALTVLEIVAPVFLLAAIGFIWVKVGAEYRIRFVTQLSMTLGVPCLIFVSLMKTELEPGALTAAEAVALHERYGSAKAAAFALAQLRDEKRKEAVPVEKRAAGKEGKEAKARKSRRRRAALAAAREAAGTDRASRSRAAKRARYDAWLAHGRNTAAAAAAVGVSQSSILLAVQAFEKGRVKGARSANHADLTREEAERLVKLHGSGKAAAAAFGCSLNTIYRRLGRRA